MFVFQNTSLCVCIDASASGRRGRVGDLSVFSPPQTSSPHDGGNGFPFRGGVRVADTHVGVSRF